MADAPNLELIVRHPTGARIVTDYLARSSGAAPFFSGHFTKLDSFRAKAAEVDGRFDRATRKRAVDAMILPEGGRGVRLDRFVDEGGYVVTTGQQPALFGGPLYSLFKALSAARLAERLERELARPVIPLFWVASEDHDWEEANHADIVGVDNQLHRLELSAPDPDVRPPLHRVRLDTQVERLTQELIAHLPDTEFSEPYAALLGDAFRSGRTLPEGFHTVMHALLGRFGMVFTDASHPVVKEGSRELLLDELDRAEELEDVLSGTGSALQAAGYDLQVPILEGGVNLFVEGPAGRERLYRDGDGFVLRTSGTRLTRDEVRAACGNPCALSPNVLLRPVVESTVFPTLAYVGGPGEMAYFAELKDYFGAHGVEMPVVVPRHAATPVERKIRKVLDKFGVDVDDLDRPFHEIAGEMARDEVPGDVRAALGKLRGAIGSGAAELAAVTRAVDPTLKGPADHMRSQAFAAVDELEKKIVQAVKRETDIALAQLQKAQIHLFPHGKPAERVQSPFYFLSRYGGAFLDSLHERFDVNLD